jgi:NADH dehydrogenase FAD-containing subunit
VEENVEPRVVIIGGGAAGVELSMSVNGRFQSQFPNSQVTLLDSGTELMPGESERGKDALRQIMQNQGIEVVHQCKVDELSEDRIFADIDGKPTIIPYTHCIWATGAGAHLLARRLQIKGLDATSHGWIKVNEYLQSTSHPFLFAAGDCCHIENLKSGSPPKAGVFAVRAGPVLIENLTRYLQQGQEQSNGSDDMKMKEYVPQSDFLKLLVCGDGRALGLRFGQAFHGKWVMKLKDKIDTIFMDLFKRENLPELSPEDDSYDTSQYDAKMAAKTTLTPDEGAELLSRTDDDVDYVQAWNVIRTMADDETYRTQVLAVLEQQQLTVAA